MTRDWESVFSDWAQPPGKTEEARIENAIRSIRNAISQSDRLRIRSITSFVQGSYRNRVNVRQDSDVDVGILSYDSFFPHYPEGTTQETFGNVDADYLYPQFKDDVEASLVSYFGSSSVTRGNKAFKIRENSYHVEADVAPFFESRRYWQDGSYRCGVALRPDTGGLIRNYPERILDSWPHTPLHYENGVSKNTATKRAYKSVVRIIKSLRNEMDENGVVSAGPVPGFLIECLVWNAPNSDFRHTTWCADVKAVLDYLWQNTAEDESCKSWQEVNDIKFLFHSSQRWTRSQAHLFLGAAREYIANQR